MGINRRRLFSKGKQSSERSIFSRELENQKGAVHLLLPLIVLIAGTVFASSIIPTTTKFPASSQVLGENEASQKAAEQAREASKKEAERQKESTQKTAEKNKESAKINIQSEGRKSELEIETSGGQKIKTKVEDDGKTEVEIEENESSDEAELEDNDEESSGSADEDDLEEVRSISKFPLRIDLTTNQLIMTKNGVERVLTVLPAKAVQNMLRAHLKKGLGPKFFEGATASATPEATSSSSPAPESSATPSASPTEEPIATESAEITILESQISLEEEDGQPVYKIPAKKHLKLFGLIPVATDFTGFISADTGALLKEQESLLSKILDLLSP